MEIYLTQTNRKIFFYKFVMFVNIVPVLITLGFCIVTGNLNYEEKEKSNFMFCLLCCASDRF